MRFLCLHGGGTNNRIFEVQTAALRYELGVEHEFHFVEGTVAYKQAEGIEALVGPEDDFFVYFDPQSAVSVAKAVDDLGQYLMHEGPFDALLAFSQGCRLAASWLLGRQKSPVEVEAEAEAGMIKAAVFISGEPGCSPTALAEGKLKDACACACEEGEEGEEGDEEVIRIRIPTLHVWGVADKVVPPERSAALVGQCDPSALRLVEHGGAHELPGPGMANVLTDVVHNIRSLF